MSEYSKNEWPHYTDKLTLLENIGPKASNGGGGNALRLGPSGGQGRRGRQAG
jgi:hypothetical protein